MVRGGFFIFERRVGIKALIPMKARTQIKDWSPNDRPREKLLEKGPTSLTDAELIAILIGSGTTSGNALDIARDLLSTVQNDLADLSNMPIADLTAIHGLGKAKAIAIKAAMEIGRRRRDAQKSETPRVACSNDAFVLLQPDLSDLPHEEFWAVYLNRAAKVVRKKRISEGGVSGTVADPRIIFRTALHELATSIIVAHNHPSGNLEPSKADIELTKKLVAAGKVLDIQVIDHLIVGGRNYCSFADSGLL